jgi:hypothetical protein
MARRVSWETRDQQDRLVILEPLETLVDQEIQVTKASQDRLVSKVQLAMLVSLEQQEQLVSNLWFAEESPLSFWIGQSFKR